MLKTVLLACTLFLGLFATALAEDGRADKGPITIASLLEGPSKPPAKNQSTPQQAQVIGCVCRNGGYYCVGVGCGPVGYVCYGCGGQGWWSTW